MKYSVYPNSIPHHRRAQGAYRGSLRSGRVEENENTRERHLANQFASVTQEADGYARIYVLLPGTPIRWYGPFIVLTEEVQG